MKNELQVPLTLNIAMCEMKKKNFKKAITLFDTVIYI